MPLVKKFPALASFRFGILMIFLAAFAMAGMAWRGLENHRKLVWSEARDEAEIVADRFLTELKREEVKIRFYDYPPTPGSFDFKVNATTDALREQMASEERTEAGLPVAVLAAYEVAKRSGSVRDGEVAWDLAMTRWPDLTTPLILERLANLAEEHSWSGDFSDWEEKWKADESARDLIRESQQTGWFSKDGQLYRAQESGEQEYDYLVLSQDSFDWKSGRYLGVSLEGSDITLGNSGVILVKRPLPEATLLVGVLAPTDLEKEWRSRRDSTFTLLGLAAIVIALGVWMMMRGVLKEKKAVAAKSQFVASVTHELRAPVGSMRLMADALDGGKLSKEKEGEFHRLMARESGRLAVLIENVMDLARVEDGKRAMHSEDFLLPDLISEVCEMMALPALEKKVTFRQEGPDLEVKADALVIRQILVNLIDNAIKFSPSGGEVLIAWNEGWWFSVTDQGPGIPKEDRKEIFERFYRREDELRRKTQGVGIGLSLVKELVTLHGGRVKVEQDVGAIFKVEFRKS